MADSEKHGAWPSVATDISEATAVKKARHVTWVGFWWNAFLGAIKVVAGVFAHSGALVADGIHSFSDFITDVIVLVFVGIARKKPDNKYQYGHGKYETFATMLIAVALGVVGLFILYEGIIQIIEAAKGHLPDKPGFIALVICALSILVKEALFHYTRRVGEEINSTAVVANAWHHRSDAFSSVATLLGIGGAYFLGHHWLVLDPIAQAVVAVFIIVVAGKMAAPAVKELLEASLPDETEDEIRLAIADTPGVCAFHHLRTRRNGSYAIVDMHIKVDPDITVSEAHSIASAVEHNIRQKIGADTLITTHIEPYPVHLADVCPTHKDLDRK